jgi:hypothetical protein
VEESTIKLDICMDDEEMSLEGVALISVMARDKEVERTDTVIEGYMSPETIGKLLDTMATHAIIAMRRKWDMSKEEAEQFLAEVLQYSIRQAFHDE